MRPKFSRWVSLLGKFRSDARGVTAIEFAMLSPAFFLLLFGIIETSIIFIGDMTLEKSTMTMARHVRVGTVSKENMTSEEFRRQLCQGIVIPMKCSELGIDLRSYSTFAEIQTISGHEPVQAGTTRFEEIRPGAIMALRVSYDWPIFVEIVRKYLATNGDEDAHTLRANNVFRVEPFE